MNVGHGTSAPLVFPLTGGEGPEVSMFHKNIAQKISTKTEENYDKVLSLMRFKIPFLFLTSVLICFRGSFPVSKNHFHLDNVSLNGQAAGLF